MSATIHPRSSYDAVVVGARCAGAATAMLLARNGLRVLAIEQSRYGSDTLSTHALMRGGVLQLRRWGVLPDVEAAGTPAIRKTTFVYGDEKIAIRIKPRDGIDALYAPRRTVLDALLVDAAREAGVEVVHGARVTELLRSDSRVEGVVVEESGREHRIASGMTIGADGVRSTVARLAGAETYREGRHGGGLVYGLWSELPDEGFEWYFRPGVSAGVIPTNGGDILVSASVPQQRFWEETRHDLEGGYHRVLQECAPGLAAAVRKARRTGPLRGYPGAPGYFRQSYGPGWALVGDAGYFRDPITAHGITDAFRDAELLARAVAKGSPAALAEYQETRDGFALGLFEASDRIASFEWDLEEVKKIHLQMSEEMNREVEALLALDETPVADRRIA